MSGTSVDGVDLALIESNGKDHIIHKNSHYRPYLTDFKNKLRKITFNPHHPTKIDLQEIKLIENELTEIHADTVNEFLHKNNLTPQDIDLIGFHGQTIVHNPALKITWQIGNGHLLAHKTKINVVADFRSKDIVLGGQGAPLVPIYHYYLLRNQSLPCAALNIGGISNITYLGNKNENSIAAFDLCFGNAPLDNLIQKSKNFDFDFDGQIASQGNVDLKIAEEILQNELFSRKPPKAFHREDFAKIIKKAETLKLEDCLATLCYIHAKAILLNTKFFAKKPKKIFLCGGGRKNKTLVQHLRDILTPENIEIALIDDIGFDGDFIEAQAFAFLAIRSVKNLPISFQKTTGVLLGNDSSLASAHQDFSSCGGVFYRV